MIIDEKICNRVIETLPEAKRIRNEELVLIQENNGFPRQSLLTPTVQLGVQSKVNIFNKKNKVIMV